MSGIRLAVHRSPLAALNGENSRAKVQNVREDSSAALSMRRIGRRWKRSRSGCLAIWTQMDPNWRYVPKTPSPPSAR